MWVREPSEDKRIAQGDDFAGDAWRDPKTGELRWCAVGYDLNENIARYDAARETE